MTRKVVVLDYGSGNLRSAQRALERVGAEVEVTADPGAAADADGLVVPGVGAFEACMTGLRAIGGEKIIADRVSHGRPVLGVCVGMQILFARGVEFGVESAGLRAVARGRDPTGCAGDSAHGLECGAGGARQRPVQGPGRRHPLLLRALLRRAEWEGDPAALLTWATHHVPFLAAVEDGPLAATQFHPEKSGDAGATLLANWVEGL